MRRVWDTDPKIERLAFVRKHGKPIRGSILHAGSGRDRYNYRQYFPDRYGYRNLDLKFMPEVHVVGDVQDMPLPDSSEDCIIAMRFLFMVPDVEKALSEIHRVLKPGGLLLASFAGPGWHPRIEPPHKFDLDDVRRLLRRFLIRDLQTYLRGGELRTTFIAASPRKERPLDNPILWFDDGFRNTFDVAFPFLRERGLRGIVAVITGKVGGNHTMTALKRQLMTVADLSQLIGEGWNIAGHSHTHPTKFHELSLEETRFEVSTSKKWIMENLGVEPDWFAAPGDRYRDEQIPIITRYFPRIRPRKKIVDQTFKPHNLAIIGGGGHLCFHLVSRKMLASSLEKYGRAWAR